MMIKHISIYIAASALLLLGACKEEKKNFDASGAFEAEETIIAAEATGTIKAFNIEEGQVLEAGQEIGYIDSTQLAFKNQQIKAQINALLRKKPNVSVQLAALQSQLRTAVRERDRLSNLVKGNAAPRKQLDDANAGIDLLKSQINAQQSSLDIAADGVGNDATPLYFQRDQIEDQLSKCKLINPSKGTVLIKYAQVNEMAMTGKALYKIADLSTINLRVYITSDQFAQARLNEQVSVMTDDGTGGMKTTQGKIIWINDKAEFTPKTIQTKDERANMVYAIKVKVPNDGSFKIGMYGEIKFK